MHYNLLCCTDQWQTYTVSMLLWPGVVLSMFIYLHTSHSQNKKKEPLPTQSLLCAVVKNLWWTSPVATCGIFSWPAIFKVYVVPHATLCQVQDLSCCPKVTNWQKCMDCRVVTKMFPELDKLWRCQVSSSIRPIVVNGYLQLVSRSAPVVLLFQRFTYAVVWPSF